MVRIVDFVGEGLDHSSYLIDLGNQCWLIPFATPGHTPDHHSFLLGHKTLDWLSIDWVAEQLADGALVVDVRPMADFGAGHLPCSLANTVRPVLASWIGRLIDPGRRLIFVVDDDQDRADLVGQSLDVAHEKPLGELGAVGVMSLPTGPGTVMCGHSARAMTPARIPTATGGSHHQMSVFDGGPDTWNTALGLEVGP